MTSREFNASRGHLVMTGAQPSLQFVKDRRSFNANGRNPLGKGFASREAGFMRSTTSYDLYSPREIALAAGVPEADVIDAMGGDARRLVAHADAVRLGRALMARACAASSSAARADTTRAAAT